MTTTVYAICYNESFLLPHFFKHYSWADRIVIYDNGSNDGSQNMVVRLGGELRHYETGNQQNNDIMRDVKNSCWKGDANDWVVVCDMDEFVCGHERLAEWAGRIVAFRCEGWQMVSESPPEDFAALTRGFQEPMFSKCACFSPRLDEIAFDHGCHVAHPKGGDIIDGVLQLRHYNMLGEQYMIDRWKRYPPRVSQVDLQHGWGGHYFFPPEEIAASHRRAMDIVQDVP